MPPRFWSLAAVLAVLVAPAPAAHAITAVPGEPGAFDIRLSSGANARASAAGSGFGQLAARSSGFLTRPSSAGPAEAGLAYVGRRPGRFRLDAEDLGGLRLVRSRRWASGLRRAEFVQTAHGIRALGPALRATADRAGRLVSLSTSAIPDLSSIAPPAPRISAGEALRRALAEVGAYRRLGRSTREAGANRNRRFAAGHRAHLVWLPVGERVRLGWRLLAFADSQHVYDAVVDARDGRTLVRRNLVKTAGSGLAWDNHPGAPAGGTQAARDLTPWLSAGDRLAGPNALVYSDVQDEIYTSLQNGQPFPQPGAADQIAPDGAGNWTFPQTLFPLDADERSCPPPEPLGSCSWDSFEGATGLTNRRQNGTQVFYFVNRFHDHLASAAGIGFTPAVGAFEGDDPLHAQVLDGAGTGGAGPDGDHLNNANMLPLPDGISPVMQMFLFTSPDLVGPGVNVGINDVNGGDDAAVVLHEYTHGLSNRLVCCDSDGFGVLAGPQGGAMDEASADWYAEDFLNAQGLQPDTPTPGEIAIGTYENLSVRTQPMDCPPGGGGPACPGEGSAGPGGYTYGDFARIVELDEVDNATGEPGPDGIPDGEVHADGEIWASTLWDLRASMLAAHGTAAGLLRARSLVTGAMLISAGLPGLPRHARRDACGQHLARLRAGRLRAHLGGVRRPWHGR